MWLSLLALFYLPSVFSQLSRTTRYDEYTLIEMPHSAFTQLPAEVSHKVDVWSHGQHNITGLIPNTLLKDIERIQPVKILSNKLQQLIDQESSRIGSKARNSSIATASQLTDSFFSEYQRHDTIVEWCKNLQTTYPDLVKYKADMGTSVEGRSIGSLYITGPSGNPPAKKPVVFITALQHAREWISGATVLVLADQLTSSYKKDKEWTNIMDSVAFVIIPVANPDGYEHTWTINRLWRKNRQNNGDGGFGVDINRNYPANWDMKEGASTDTDSEVYKGPKAASEPEVRALMAEFKLYKAQVAFAVDVHSFSELILRPQSHTAEPASDENKLKAVSQGIANAIMSVNKRKYEQIRAFELYPTSGDLMAWWRIENPSLMSFSLELSPGSNDERGFILPPEDIRSVGADVVAAMKWVATDIASKKTGQSSGSQIWPSLLLAALGIVCAI